MFSQLKHVDLPWHALGREYLRYILSLLFPGKVLLLHWDLSLRSRLVSGRLNPRFQAKSNNLTVAKRQIRICCNQNYSKQAWPMILR